MALSVNTRLGHYEVLGPLGAGGMGEVYRARDTRLGRDVALKTISPPRIAADADATRAIRARGAGTCRAQSSEHRCTSTTLVDRAGQPVLVLELVDGDDARRSHRGPDACRSPTRSHIARADCRGAQTRRMRHGIVHRDLKPANIKTYATMGRMKVLDFGLAEAITARRNGHRLAPTAALSPTITSTRSRDPRGRDSRHCCLHGPGAGEGRRADKRSDIWAFGAVLYEMLTARRAFDRRRRSQRRSPLCCGSDIGLGTPLPTFQLPQPYRNLLRRCLAKGRATATGRYLGDARFVLTDDAAAFTGVGLSATAPIPPCTPSSQPSLPAAVVTSGLVCLPRSIGSPGPWIPGGDDPASFSRKDSSVPAAGQPVPDFADHP